jgi:cellulose synthase/poly-beta-1,6-N-acetylglucosamine synthase-like glycosyltransferase
MNFWWILYVVDGLLFVAVLLTVLYFLVFSVASMMKHRVEVKRAKEQYRYIVLIPSYKNDKVIVKTVNSVLGQSYPQRLFDVVVVSDHQSELVNMQLAQLPVTLLTPDFEISSKAKSLQYAVLHLPRFKIYDAVLILDAGNIVKPEFLKEVNDAYVSSGTKAIQTHRLSANRETTAARLDAIFEEINTAIFRRGHQVMGLSAALNGSGMVFDFQWFKTNIMKVRTAIGEDKALEALLAQDNIFVDYFEDIYVFDEKVHDMKQFNDQHARWAHTQLHALLSHVRYLPQALINRHYDHVDKIVQWMLIPRTTLMGIIALMSVVLPFIYMTLVIKWWIVAALVMLAFAFATPDYLVDEHFNRDFAQSPKIIVEGIANIFRAGGSETTVRVSSAKKWLGRLRAKFFEEKGRG